VPQSPVRAVVHISALNPVVFHHDGVAHQTSLRSPHTMMTLTNSLQVREAGSLITFPVTDSQDQLPTQASPHASEDPYGGIGHAGKIARSRCRRAA
jgi:hypothetical protein